MTPCRSFAASGPATLTTPRSGSSANLVSAIVSPLRLQPASDLRMRGAGRRQAARGESHERHVRPRAQGRHRRQPGRRRHPRRRRARRAHRRHRQRSTSPGPARSSMRAACTCCRASSIRRCTSASRGSSIRKIWRAVSRSAVLGGVTAVFEMPNTKPLTTTASNARRQSGARPQSHVLRLRLLRRRHAREHRRHSHARKARGLGRHQGVHGLLDRRPAGRR